MHQKLRVEIDPFRLAKQGLILEGKLSLSTLPRLVDVLDNSDGDIGVKMHFDINKILATPTMVGHFKASLPLICERCSKVMSFDADVHCKLAIMNAEKTVEGLDEEYESWVIENSDPVLLSSVVEDELILAIPLVPKHEHSCLPAEAWFAKGNIAEEKIEKKVSPFAVLSELKLKD